MAFYNRNRFGEDETHRLIAEGIALWINRNRKQGMDPVTADEIRGKRPEMDPREMMYALRRQLPSGNG